MPEHTDTSIVVVPKLDILKKPPKFTINKAKVALLVTEYETLTIDGVDDREGYQIAHKARMNVRAHLLEIEACRKHSIPAGVHVVQPDAEQLRAKVAKGFTLIAYSVDQLLLGNSAAAAMDDVKRI